MSRSTGFRPRRPSLRLTVAIAVCAAVFPAVSDEDSRPRVVRWTEGLDAAWLELEEGRFDGAIVRFEGLRDEIGARAPGTLHHARAVAGLADARRRSGQAEAAADLYREVLPMWERLLGPDQPRVALALYHLGLVEAAGGREDQARAALQRAITVWEGSPGNHARSVDEARRALRRLGPGLTPPSSE